ncbi:MAG: DoxX family protein [Sphingomicrobium sp.]
MQFTWLSPWQPHVRAVLRIVVALLFLQHGLIKLIGFPSGGMPGPQTVGTLLWVAGIIELVTSLLVLIGLWTRVAAFLASGEMAVAYFMFHASKGFYPALNMGEGAILYCFIFLYLAAAGPGAWSIDGARQRSAPIR